MTVQQLESQEFNLNEFAFDAISDDQWQEANKQRSKPLDEGNHTLTIKSIRNLGKDKIDASWYSLSVTCSDVNGNDYSGIVKMPTNSPVFTRDGKASTWELVKFKGFATALGLDVSDQKKVQSALSKLVDGIVKEKYVGKAMAVELGYSTDHLKYVSQGCYTVVDREGKPLEGAPEVFADAASANDWYGSTREPKADGSPRKLQYIQIKRFGDSAIKTK